MGFRLRKFSDIISLIIFLSGNPLFLMLKPLGWSLSFFSFHLCPSIFWKIYFSIPSNYFIAKKINSILLFTFLRALSLIFLFTVSCLGMQYLFLFIWGCQLKVFVIFLLFTASCLLVSLIHGWDFLPKKNNSCCPFIFKSKALKSFCHWVIR